MRNLKRVLSLALASAMLFGMMVVGASAADKKPLTDLDKVTNKEAVNLMVDLGIIVGKPDGSFAPTETVDRATMAKLITYVMMGDVDAALFEGTTTDLKDIDTNWAKGYIKYCYANNIITGDGMGSFFPGNKVTVVQAAKMLLVAIGYDSAVQGYVGNNWSVNIMKDAKTSGLLAGVAASTNDELTRDNAAQMIFNALFAKTITYTTQYDGGKAYKVDPSTSDKAGKANATLGQLQYNLGKIEAIVTGINADGTAITSITGTNAPLNPIVNGKLAAAPELVGGKVVAYYNTNTSKLISTGLTSGSSTVLASVNTGIANMTNAVNPTHKDYVAAIEAAPVGASQNPTVTYFVNGAATNGSNRYGNGIADAAAGGTTSGSAANTTADVAQFINKAGCIVDFVDTDASGKADVIRITYKTVATLTADPTTKVVGDTTQVKVPGVINAFSASDTTKTVVGYEGLAKGDVVLFVKIANMTYIETATMVEGVVKGTNSAGKLSVDGTYYGTSGLKNASNGWTSNDFVNTYKFYLDNAKNIVKGEKVTDQTTGSYAVVLQTSWVNGTGALGESNYAQAKVLLPDGTTEIVTVAKVGGKTIIAPAATVSTAGADEVNYSLNNSTTASNFAITTGAFYTYTKDSKGVYSLTAASGIVGTGKAITNGKAAIVDATSPTPATVAVANNNTVFLLKTGTATAPVYTSYTGIANVPSMTAATMTIVVKDGLAAYVYVSNTGTLTGTVGEYIYVPTTNGAAISYVNVPTTDGTGIAYLLVNAIVNGEATTIKVKDLATLSSKISANTMYTVKAKDVDGVISDVNTTTSATKVGVSVSGGTLLAGTSDAATQAAYIVNGDTQIFYIGTDGTVSTLDYTAVTADKTDKVIVIDSNNDAKAETVYIMQVISTTATLTSAQQSVDGATATPIASFGGANKSATIGSLTAGKIVEIKDIVIADGATFVISGNPATVAANSGTDATITIVVTAEDGVTTDTYTITVSKAS